MRGVKVTANSPRHRPAVAHHEFVRLAELHRRLIGLVDQKVGGEKAIMRKYVAALDRRLAAYPRTHYDRWRKGSAAS